MMTRIYPVILFSLLGFTTSALGAESGFSEKERAEIYRTLREQSIFNRREVAPEQPAILPAKSEPRRAAASGKPRHHRINRRT